MTTPTDRDRELQDLQKEVALLRESVARMHLIGQPIPPEMRPVVLRALVEHIARHR